MSHSPETAQPDIGMGHKTLATYALGFLLCIILTLIPFFSVIHPIFEKKIILAILLLSAVLQFFVQVICFLRMNYQTEQSKMNVMSFVFAGVVLFVVIGGSVWIMTSLNYFMM